MTKLETEISWKAQFDQEQFEFDQIRIQENFPALHDVNDREKLSVSMEKWTFVKSRTLMDANEKDKKVKEDVPDSSFHNR